MKKIIITTIAGIILATVITGCGKDTEKTAAMIFIPRCSLRLPNIWWITKNS